MKRVLMIGAALASLSVTAFAGPMGRGRFPYARTRGDGAQGPQAGAVTPARCEVLRGDNGAELLIYGVIDSLVYWGDEVTAASVIEALTELDGEDVTVRINSPGGLVTEGLAIYNALLNYSGKVTTQVDGLAASIASVIMMAGETRRAASDKALVMIHNAWGLAIGDHSDMRRTADLLQKMDGQIAGTYAARGGGTKDEFLAAMAVETWYDSAEAVAAGLLTEVLGGDAAEAVNSARMFDLSGFANLPKALRASATPAPAATPAPVAVDPPAPEASINQADLDAMQHRMFEAAHE